LDYLTTHTKSITNTTWVRARLCKLQKGCTRLAAACDKVYTSCLPMIGGSLRVLPSSSTTKTGRHNIAEIFLKLALNTINQIKCIHFRHFYELHKPLRCLILFIRNYFCSVSPDCRHIYIYIYTYNCYLYMPSRGPDLVNKLISISIHSRK
jgi:hypothetical protein